MKKTRRKSVGIADVAAAAKVSTTTVSYILNNTQPYAHQFTPETRQRVLDAARQLQYSPNVFGASLRTRRRSLVGVYLGESFGRSTIWDRMEVPYGGDYLLELLYGINEAALELDVFPIVRMEPPGGPKHGLEVVRQLRRIGVGEVLVYRPGEALITQIAEEQANSDTPQYVVVYGAEYRDRISCYLDIDNAAVGREAARLLAAQHVRQACVVANEVPGVDMEARINSALAELSAAGIRFGDGVHRFRYYDDRAGCLELQRQVAECIFSCSADGFLGLNGGLTQMIAQLMHARGRRIPEEVRLSGVDCANWYVVSVPPAPSIHASWRTVGRMGLWALRGPQTGDHAVKLPGLLEPVASICPEYAQRIGWLV